jgi:hypothetical protein
MNIPSAVIKVGGPVAAGAGVILLAPVVAPVAGRVLKPVIKTTIKGALIAYGAILSVGGRVKTTAAETVEALEDIAAEAKEEVGAGATKAVAKTKKPASKAKAKS